MKKETIETIKGSENELHDLVRTWLTKQGRTHIRIPEKGSWLIFDVDYSNEDDFAFFKKASAKLREFGLYITANNTKGYLPRLRYGLEKLIGKKEILSFVKLLNSLHKKHLLKHKEVKK